MNLPLTLRKLVTVICEADLEAHLVADLTQLGVRGYTITDARGSGAHGPRDAAWRASANIRVELLCDEAMAQQVAETLHERYYAHYGMVMFITDAAVLRPQKFSR
ncbi:transcriptional regulator [Zoogloea sp.]|uniref:P-II family nitrogen regulator n=1 Tax=Zoogloea sp. TaxID=49181 RepID=UPI002631C706|nr:transcriptional regulator [Zoogloea sp.]MDD3352793.1 transcriptional regulator [Zoogloea sp.]